MVTVKHVYTYTSLYIYIYRRHFGLHVEILIKFKVRGSKQSVGLLQTSYIDRYGYNDTV